MNQLKIYKEKVPCCGIYCGGCPNYLRQRNGCSGQSDGCEQRKCKTIYSCCVEKKGLSFCFECNIYPCSRYRKFADRWKKYGQDLLKNQDLLKQNGEKWFIEYYNNLITN